MFKKNKKKIYAIIILLIILAVGFGVWFFFGDNGSDKEDGAPFGSNAPFGSSGEGGGFSGGSGEGGVAGEDGKIPQLYQITNAPIAGAAGFTRGEGTTTPFVRFMDRASGNVFELSYEDFTTQRITNTTIPRVHEAFFTKKGSGVVARYLDDDGQTIKTFMGDINEPEVDGEIGTIEGRFLPEGIRETSVSSNGSSLIYINPENASGELVRMSLKNPDDRDVIFSFPFSEWLIDWEDRVYLTSKPSGVAQGYSYALNGGELEKVAGGIGLTVLPSPSGRFILHSDTGQGTLGLRMRNVDADNSRTVPFNTLPEKCAWNDAETRVYCGVPKEIPAGTYPDTWYQGVVQFSDSLQMFSTKTNVSSSISALDTQSGQPIDVVHPFLGPEGKYFFFTNKRDGTLWSFRLEANTGTSTNTTNEGVESN